MNANTLFLRLEGNLQAWGDQQSKFVVRRTAEAPTKSAVIGMLCAALGVSRAQAADEWLPKLNDLRMGVRIDMPGIRWWDYHTVGAGMRIRIAEGGTKPGAMLTRREYLCDASFLVALQGHPDLISRLEVALQSPKWTLYLGRKCCPPSRPILEEQTCRSFDDLLSALRSIPWQKRLKQDMTPEKVDCLLDWVPEFVGDTAPSEAIVWYDAPITFEPPAHHPRFVIGTALSVGLDGELAIADGCAQQNTPRPPRPRANYGNTEYRRRRADRLTADHHLCVFCKAPATTVQHITYRRAGGSESQDDLRSLCRLCHDAVTMIEYGHGMGIDRINPEDPRWRDLIITKREDIIKFRSLETRRRHFAAEEVE
ncbi:MAG: type I-E CRISPR-associated protein Cas5/CasD [Armatimonadetes bacterium]|nr:type I-E CRISPR-associated protein Cas5/CasD [Armatimonadota bacterium]